MSYLSLPRGIFRKNNNKDTKKFIPKSMIDMLFSYDDFLRTSEANNGSIVSIPPKTKKKVAIIGAGAAGLVSAFELSKVENIEVTLFESSDRLGGRMDSTVIPDGKLNNKIFEMGCMRFPPTSHTLYYYLNKFGLRPVPNFPDPGVVSTELLYKNQLIAWPEGKSAPDNSDFERIGQDFGKMLIYILGDVNSPNLTKPSKLFDFWAIYQKKPSLATKQAVISAWQLIINQYNFITYYDAVYELGQNTSIVNQQWSQEDMNKFGALGVGSGGFGPLYSVNFIEILRLFANGWEDNQELLLTGISSLVKAFHQAIKDKATIRMNSKITKINLLKDGDYQLDINALGGEESSSKFDSVIVATTTRAMEFMGLTVDGVSGNAEKLSSTSSLLEQGPKDAIRNLHLMNSSKLFVTTTSKFWYAKNNSTGEDLPFNIQTDEVLRGLYCLNYDQDLPNGLPNTAGKGVVLISYVWGDDSTKLQALTTEERFQQFLKVIEKINPTFAENLKLQVEKVQIIDWQNESNYYGAFKLNYPGQEQDNQAAFFQYQTSTQGIILAGDSVSWAGGWLEGAMPTGVNAACAAAAYMGAKIDEHSPLSDIPANMYVYNNPPTIRVKNNFNNINPKDKPLILPKVKEKQSSEKV